MDHAVVRRINIWFFGESADVNDPDKDSDIIKLI